MAAGISPTQIQTGHLAHTSAVSEPRGAPSPKRARDVPEARCWLTLLINGCGRARWALQACVPRLWVPESNERVKQWW